MQAPEGSLWIKAIRLYEAGGRSSSWLPNESSERASIVVVDIDEPRSETTPMLTRRCHQGIQSTALPPVASSLIVCCNMIEHLPKALERDAIRLTCQRASAPSVWVCS